MPFCHPRETQIQAQSEEKKNMKKKKKIKIILMDYFVFLLKIL